MKKLKRILLGLLATGFLTEAQNCNLTVNTTPVSCYGSIDGKAEIWKDGKLIVIGGGTTNGDPATCVAPIVSPYSCGSPVSGAVFSNATSGVVEIPDGKTLYLTSNFTGDIRFLGTNTLVICGTSEIVNFQMNNNSKPIKIVVNGQATLSSANINLDHQSIVENYGTLNITNNIGFNGKLLNYKDLFAEKGIDINSPNGQMYNGGNILIKGSYKNMNVATNAGHMQVNGNFHNNGSSGFRNLCTIKIGLEFLNSTFIENYGKIIGVNTNVTITNIAGGSIYKAYAGSLLATKDIIVDGIIDGLGTTCAAVKVAGHSRINGSGIVRNKIDYCDANGIEVNTGQIVTPPVTTNCSCPANGSGTSETGTVTWRDGTSILNGSTATGLKSGTSIVTVDIVGCNKVDLDVVITSPKLLTASVSVSGNTATVSNIDGGNPGIQYFDWKKLPDGLPETTTVPNKQFSIAGEYTVTVRDSKGCLSAPKQFTITGGSTTCNFTVVTTPVTCFGGSDGKVVIYKDGQPLNYQGNDNTNNNGNTGEPIGQPGTCTSPQPSPYSCLTPPSNATINQQTGGTVSVVTGDLIFLKSNFVGDLSIGGGTLVICGDVTINNFNYKTPTIQPFTLIINGTAKLTAPNMNLKENCTVKNYGDLTTKSIGFNGSLENHGYFTVEGDLDFNTAGNTYLNTGTIKVNTNFNNKMTTINGGTFIVLGLFNNNETTSLFRNYCTLTVEGVLNNNKDIENKGYIIVRNNRTTFNSNSYYKGYAGSVLYTKDFTNNKIVEGIESCASIRVLQETKLNNTSVLKGLISLCDATVSSTDASAGTVTFPASLSCSCGGTPPNTTGPIVWNGYPNVTGSTLSNITAGGPRTVTINWPGCGSVTLTYTIGGPSTAISASVSVNNATATLPTPTGGNGGPYSYKWSPDDLVTQVGNRTYGQGGDYTVTVYDSKSCQGPTLPFYIAPTGVEDTCETIVEYRTDNQVLVKIICPGTTCQYQIKKGDGGLMAYGALLKRPCKDSIVVSENCKGELIETGIKGSGTCGPEIVCDPDTDPTCPELKVTYTTVPTLCSSGSKAILTISNGTGNYWVYDDKHLGQRGSGPSPITLYEMPGGTTKVWVVDQLTKKEKEVTVVMPEVPKSTVVFNTTALSGSTCKNQLYINLTNANTGPYRVDMSCCDPWYIGNLNASNGVLTAGPYTITNANNAPASVKVTDAYCNVYSTLVTPCNEKCTPEATYFVPNVQKTAPSYKGENNGSITLLNLPANHTATWTGGDIFNPIQGATLSGVKAGNYVLLVVNTLTLCKFETIIPLEDGIRAKAQYNLIGDCQYEAQLTMVNVDGSPSATVVPGPITYIWLDRITGLPVASGKQLNVKALPKATLLSRKLVLQTKDGQNHIENHEFTISPDCVPSTPCPYTVRYRASNPTCHDGTDGRIRIVSLAPSNRFVTWLTPALRATGISNWHKPNLTAGNYSLGLGSNDPLCGTEAVYIHLANPPALVVNKEELLTGGVRITVQNGKPKFTFAWLDRNPQVESDQTESVRTDLVPNTTYTVKVTDAKGCFITYSFLYNPCALSKPKPLVYLHDQKATVINTKGTSPFTYTWTGAGIDVTEVNLTEQVVTTGAYTVEVKDVKGCTATVAFDADKCGLTLNPNLSTSASSVVCTGQAVLGLKVGNTTVTDFSNYAILWDQSPIQNILKYTPLETLLAQSTPRFTNACVGSHTYAVVTPGGCVLEQPFEIQGPIITDNCLTTLSIVGPTSNTFTRLCHADPLNIIFDVKGGTSPYTYDWTLVQGSQTKTFTNLTPGLSNPETGVYTVVVKDKYKICSATATYTVNGPSQALSMSQKPTPPVCPGGSGNLLLNLGGGTKPYTITWSDGTITSNSTGIVNKSLTADQDYSFTLSDANSCTLKGEENIASQRFEGRAFEGQIYYNRLKVCPGKVNATLTAAQVDLYTFKWQGVGITANNQYDSQIEVGQVGQVSLVYTPSGTNVCTLPVTFSVTLTEKCEDPKRSLCDVREIDLDPIPQVDACSNTLKNVATANVERKYEIYIAQAKKNFADLYRKTVMESLTESFTIEYNDREHHYTLYHYDQAGNLVRTVPPAGVTALTEDQTTTAITQMKQKNNTGTIMQHTLPTTYKYNSLNQLITQDMPDHRQQDLWEAQAGYSIPTSQTIMALDQIGGTPYAFANSGTQAYLYHKTGATTWVEELKLDLGELNEVCFAGGSTFYAVGKEGTLLKSEDNGTTWTIKSTPTTAELVKVWFSSSSSGFIMTGNGSIYYTSNSGVTWLSNNTLMAFGITVQDLFADANGVYVLSTQNKIYYAGAYTANFANQGFDIKGLTATYYDGSDYLVAGPKGTIFKYSISSPSDELRLLYKTNLTGSIKKFFKIGTTFYAWVDVNGGSIYTSTDGSTWTTVAGNPTGVTGLVEKDGIAIALRGNQTFRSNNTWQAENLIAAYQDFIWDGSTGYYIANSKLYPTTNTSTLRIVQRPNVGSNPVTYTELSVKQVLKSGINYYFLATDNNFYTTTNLSATPITVALVTGVSGINSFQKVGSSYYDATYKKITFTGTTTATLAATASFTVTGYVPANGTLAIRGSNATDYLYTNTAVNLGSLYKSNIATAQNNKIVPIGLKTIVKDYAAGDRAEFYARNSTVWEFRASQGLDATVTKLENNGIPLTLAAADKVYTADADLNIILDAAYPGTGTVVKIDRPIVATATGGLYSRINGSWTSMPKTTGLNITVLKALAKGEGDINTAPTKAVALNGTDIYYWDNGAWKPSIKPIVLPIYTFATGGSKLLAAGKQGTILSSTNSGASWKPQPLNTSEDITAIQARGSKAVFGTVTGTVFYSTSSGDSWTAVNASNVPGSGTVRNIAIGADGAIWLLRGNNLLYSANNTTFTSLLSADQPLYSIYLDDQGYGYIVGDVGTAYRIQPTASFTLDQKKQASCTGTTVEPSPLGSTGYATLLLTSDLNVLDDRCSGIPRRPLRTVRFTDRLKGYLTGTEGLILKTVDGGYRWQRESAETNNNANNTTFITSGGSENATIATGNQIGNVRDRAQQLSSRYWYDELGRLVLSQNSKQYNIGSYLTEKQYEAPASALTALVAELIAADPAQAALATKPARAYSYTLYDEVGRITEVGELLTRSDLATHKAESQILYSSLPAFMAKGIKEQITRTYYDAQVFEPEVNGQPLEQQNLRPRVASVTYSDQESPSGGAAGGGIYDRATHYSYDIHGNVKTLIQEIKSNVKGLNSNLLVKRLDYDYDLISDKVNYVYYQKGQADQLSHKYTYDGDNRITQVHTSTDGVNWTRDARYEYYAHGPLAKTELGAQSVETSVYAYTIQGWIKGVQGQNFSYALGYNSTDYKGIEAAAYGGQTVGLKETPIAERTVNGQLIRDNLYNGNIATWATNTPALSVKGVADMTNQYTYDQINRIKSSKVLNRVNAFSTKYQYDANGNILALQRYNEAGQKFDAFRYNYEEKRAGYMANTNKLRSVDDTIVNQALHAEDLEDQDIDNYQYDDIGNLNFDRQEDIDRIEWTAYGKIKALYRKEGSLKPNLVFEYNPSGNRVSKISISNNGDVRKTFYLRDASDNVISTYEMQTNKSLALKEQHLYGSSRLGILENGSRSYEINDHLGNVRAVVNEFKELKSAYEYFAFGMSLAKIDNGYRFGFNGKEKEGDLSEDYYDLGARFFSAKIGKFLSIDPLAEKYPWQSPYAYNRNSPISSIDWNGLGDPPTTVEYIVDKDKAGKSEKLEDGRNVTYVNDNYEAAILKGNYVYASNYGWVDRTHAFGETKRNDKSIGAANLWKQINEETGEKGENGFKVTYRQDARVFGMNIGVTQDYWIQNDLSVQEKRSVAMSILQEVSLKFESLQGFAVWSGSSFEPSDLTSNLLGLYKAMIPELTKTKIEELIQPLSPEESLQIYQQYPGTFTDSQYKNYSFYPKTFKNNFCVSPVIIVPEILRSVQPSKLGTNHTHWDTRPNQELPSLFKFLK